MDDLLIEPLKAYENYYERDIEKKARERIAELISVSGIDIAANRATAAEFRKESVALDAVSRVVSHLKTARVFSIIAAVVSYAVAVAGIAMLACGYILAGALMLSLGAAAGTAAVLAVALKVNGDIGINEKRRAEHAANASEKAKIAWEQTAPLVALFDGKDTERLIESVVPSIELDDNFDLERFDLLRGKYGFGDNTDDDRSTVEILTGEIGGNPFFVDRELVKTMGTYTYTGSISISWTTTSYDSDGQAHTEHHSEMLTASVTKPKPYYSVQTRLIYGNEAAPDLSFTHTATHAESLDGKALERKIKSGIKRVRKRQDESLARGDGTFTEMGNEEFDALFGALDRNNEVQFRSMFTPLGQKNMLELMKSKVGYGDDFNFCKRGCLNYISSEHSQKWNLDASSKSFASYDADIIAKNFIDFNTSYFKNLYFDLAPLLSVPLYQQNKPHEYAEQNVYGYNYTSYETERAVNGVGQSVFAHESAATESILKTVPLSKDGRTDEVGVTALSFRAEPRVEYVSEFGGDGHMHDVPVHWTEYIPVSRQNIVKIKRLGISDKRFKELADGKARAELENEGGVYKYSHGMLCCLCNNGNENFDKRMDDAFETYRNN